MLDFYSYAQHNYQLLKPKRSLCIRDLLEIPRESATEDDLMRLLRHLKYEREVGSGDSEVAEQIYEYFGINNIDLL